MHCCDQDLTARSVCILCVLVGSSGQRALFGRQLWWAFSVLTSLSLCIGVDKHVGPARGSEPAAPHDVDDTVKVGHAYLV